MKSQIRAEIAEIKPGYAEITRGSRVDNGSAMFKL